MSTGCSLLGCGIDEEEAYEQSAYEGPLARWCPGCGDHMILAVTQRLLFEEQLRPEQVVFVSGIGCSSRFPHYMKTYGFHGIHGRALPVATGIKLTRPDLHVFTVMGDGDCCSIGAAHWIHAIRYNVNMVAMLLDNNIYGLTKNQTSPTTPKGHPSNTQPRGSYLPALNPLTATLGVTNASFVAQTADWAPGHLHATLQAAYRHKGFAFVRILQRCPVWTPAIFRDAAQDPRRNEILVHEKGIRDADTEKLGGKIVPHDPSDLHAARRLAEEPGAVRLGLFYRDESKPRYDETRHQPVFAAEERIRVLDEEFDRYAV
ncbi:MAG TPA: thiamine pyrophosphate-dependent enzyme [Planctomycetota bacterium]|nr:thiamine pyrophosphate-dependent enzyme [Planctomycetota bacterium]